MDPDHEIAFLQTKKKPAYPIGETLRRYLKRFNRDHELPVSYERLLRFEESAPVYDREGNDTLWESVIFNSEEREALARDLVMTYAVLKAEGDPTITRHLYADRIDYCTFGNTRPFRIRVVNAYNDNQDYYYVKRGDASRVYGLELEHLLSPNRMHYLTSGDTLIEEHVVGIPGDVFIEKWMKNPDIKKIRLAKELVKFNERCFIRLLGDMRAYNFVVDLTPDFEELQIRIRPMDFDQQSYSGRMNFYRPQFFKENNPFALFCMKHLNIETARQYQREEQALIHRRVKTIEARLSRLLEAMRRDRISTAEKIASLRSQLAEHYQNDRFHQCERMGDVLALSLDLVDRRMEDPRLNPLANLPVG